MGRRQRDGHHGIRSEPGKIRLAIELAKTPVDGRLIGGVDTDQRPGDRHVDIFDGPQDSCAAQSVGVAVAKLEGLESSFAGAAGGDGPPGFARAACDLDFDRGPAAAVENLAGTKMADSGGFGGMRHARARISGTTKK